MKYLCIENPSVCPIEGCTIFGLSSSRGNSSKIGQFGSGFKHALLFFLRQDQNPIIYLGKDRVEYRTEGAIMGGDNPTPYNKVFFRVNGKGWKEMSVALEFGELDWTDIKMALREFVSNAIDGGGVTFKIADRPSPTENKTIVAVPYTASVADYYNNIKKYFLQLRENADQNCIVVDKFNNTTSSKPNIYRRGVFVRTIDNRQSNYSLYDYNLQNADIDECRNMMDANAVWKLSEELCDSPRVYEIILDAIVEHPNSFEGKVLAAEYYIKTHFERNKEACREVWTRLYGDKVWATQRDINRFGTQDNCVIVGEEGATLLKYSGIPSIISVLNNVSSDGYVLIEPNAETTKTTNEVWNALVECGMTNDKPLPRVFNYQAMMVNGTLIRGFYDGKKNLIGISLEDSGCKRTIIEELAHYVTGAKDATIDFQDYAFNVCVKLMGGN